jgi:hypothetical protein
MLHFLHELETGGPIPQIFVYSSDAGSGWESFDRMFHERIRILSSPDGSEELGCYKLATKTIYWMKELHNYRYRYIYKISGHPHCRNRVIKRGYYKNNKSLGASADFEFAF